jgi:hypothetical protein
MKIEKQNEYIDSVNYMKQIERILMMMSMKNSIPVVWQEKPSFT